jgi:hypothetical protein
LELKVFAWKLKVYKTNFNGSVKQTIKSLIHLLKDLPDARYVFNLLKYDSVSNLVCEELGWLFAKYSQQFKTLKLAYNIVNNTAPVYFRNYLTYETVEGICTRHRQYVTPAIQALTPFGRESFRYCASKELLELPSFISTNLSFRSYTAQIQELLKLSQTAEFCFLPDGELFCDLSCIDDVVNSLYIS